MALTDMQKRYIWLAGSYPQHVVVQGRGKRTPKTLYALDGESLYVFGYSNPLYFLLARGLFRKLQDDLSYSLTVEGEAEFRRMLARGEGLKINGEIREARLAARSPKMQLNLCQNCGEETPKDEAACLACGHTKPWAAEST